MCEKCGLALALLIAACIGAPPAGASPYHNGDRVQATGVVTDTEGKPMPGVQVVLESGRRYISLRELRRGEKDMQRLSTVTDARGEYTLEWPWDRYFNRFELLAGVNVRRGKEESLEILEREDISERVFGGSPVVAAIVVHNRGFVDRLHEFVASIQSADQHRTYDEMGTPDDVKRVDYTGRPQETEVSWWYFDAGKAYRFRNGRLEQVERFDPVQRF